ncbi:LuxR family transcriptional regulator [Janthinobacterium sp. SUN073]|uniref:helix-turn-helix transcriptional regulator n=1 Tax=Janthinobacterium sp. SUN073 TaxID=3004102 RepID=UPI0025B173D6|nr:LuxR family transcriptional regulator [Janthinobacterium sp. SUN073]MDN2697347.1 LuxR family transcriptional regulator [Janthinobacterium sp. SUN073]
MDKDGADTVIADFYRAALEPSHWSAALRAFARLAGGDVACCFLKAEAEMAPSRACVTGLDEQAWEHGYRRYYHTLDPGYAVLTRAPPGRMHLMQDYFSDQAVARSEYFQDFYLRAGVRYSCSGVVRDNGALTILSAHRAAGQGPYDANTHSQLQRVLDHLPNVFRLRDTAQQAQAHGALAWEALDALPRAILLVDACLRLVFMNLAAQRLLAAAPQAHPLIAVRGGGVQVRASLLQQQLAQRVRQACVGLACHRPAPLYACDADGRPALEIGILPLPVRIGQDGVGDAAVMAMLSLRPLFRAGWRRWPGAFERPWGLTGAEWALALALADGMEPAEYARQKGVRISTVRSQIQAILAKTGTRRSSEIASLFSALEWDAGAQP